MQDLDMCKKWNRMDAEYMTPTNSPLHHDNRCTECRTK